MLDRGPDAGHPVDAQLGHREDCGRLAAEASRYIAGLDADDQLAAGMARVITDMSEGSRLGSADRRRWPGAGSVVSNGQGEISEIDTNQGGRRGRRPVEP